MRLLLFLAFQTYQSAQVNAGGQLVLTLSNQESVQPAKIADQVSFSQAVISGDGQTVGWLVDYANPDGPTFDKISGTLVLYRAGHVLRSFPSGQDFWSWRFANHDRDVAFCIGPLHGGAACELHRIRSGRLLRRWGPEAKTSPPAWVQGLNY